MGDFAMGLFIGLIGVVFTLFCLDRTLREDEFNYAVNKCPDNGGMKFYSFDNSDATVYCNNGAVFTYKRGEHKK